MPDRTLVRSRCWATARANCKRKHKAVTPPASVPAATGEQTVTEDQHSAQPSWMLPGQQCPATYGMTGLYYAMVTYVGFSFLFQDRVKPESKILTSLTVFQERETVESWLIFVRVLDFSPLTGCPSVPQPQDKSHPISILTTPVKTVTNPPALRDPPGNC